MRNTSHPSHPLIEVSMGQNHLAIDILTLKENISDDSDTLQGLTPSSSSVMYFLKMIPGPVLVVLTC
jgi:hypothetical protein